MPGIFFCRFKDAFGHSVCILIGKKINGGSRNSVIFNSSRTTFYSIGACGVPPYGRGGGESGRDAFSWDRETGSAIQKGGEFIIVGDWRIRENEGINICIQMCGKTRPVSLGIIILEGSGALIVRR